MTDHQTAAALQSLTYAYDTVGNITSIIDASETDSAKTTAYAYDDLYRLTSATITGSATTPSSFAYSYNILGNIITRTIDGVTSTYTYDGNTGDSYANPHAVTSITVTSTPESATPTPGGEYTYDESGNLTGIVDETGVTTTNTWDSKNRLTNVDKQITEESDVTTDTTVQIYATAGDGAISKNSTTWDAAHDATSGTASSTATTAVVNSGKNATGQFTISRGFLAFDTSTIPDDATVTSATLKTYVQSKTNNDNDGDDFITIVQGSQASSSTLAGSDYDNAGSVNTPTEGIATTERKDITSIATNAYLSFSLNSTGQGFISKTGNTLLGAPRRPRHHRQLDHHHRQ